MIGMQYLVSVIFDTAGLATPDEQAAIDGIRREDKRGGKHLQAQLLYDDDPPGPPGAIDDERLRLIFTCCHPALAMQTRVHQTLRMVAGLTVPEIARAFLVQETAIGVHRLHAARGTRVVATVTGPGGWPDYPW
jgi:predicted RNA polymerase sigma factor